MKIFEYRGVSGLVAAEIVEDSTENYTTGEVFEIAGVSQIEKQTESNEETHYYDNIAAVVITATGADTITIDASAIPLDVLAKITGQTYDAAKGMYVEHERKSKYFALGYKTKTTDGTEIYVWRNKGKFGVPNETNVTEDAGTTANGQQIVYTGVSTIHKFAAIENIPAKSTIIDTSVNDIPEETFFGTVQTPDTIADPTVVTGIAVVPSAISVAENETYQLQAVLTPAGATGEVTWASSDDTYATVSASGLVTGKAAGSATITATCGTFTDTCVVTITA